MINLGGEVGSVCSEGPWLFVGMPNVVKVSLKPSNVVIFFFQIFSVQDVTLIWHVGDMLQVWNTESGAEYSLNGPVGQVNALESVNDLLFAGVEVSHFTSSLEFLCSFVKKKKKKKNSCVLLLAFIISSGLNLSNVVVIVLVSHARGSRVELGLT